VGALLYAVHATHTEAICVIAYRTSLLSDGAVLWGLLLHLAANQTDTTTPPTRRLWLLRRGAVPLLFAAGLAAKESAATLLGLLVAADVLRVGRPPGPHAPGGARRALATYLPLVVVFVGYLALRRALLAPVPVSYFEGIAPLFVALTMLKALVLYARLLLLPYPLTPFYDWTLLPPAASVFEPDVMAGLVLFVALLAGLGLTFRRHPRAAFLIAAFGVGLLPYAHIVPFVVPAADRFLLLSSFAFTLGLARSVDAAVRVTGRRAWWAVPLALIVLNAGLSVRRNTHWRTQERILQQTAADHPDSLNARMRFGEHAQSLGQYAVAEAEFRAAVALLPGLEAPVFRLIEVLMAQGRHDAARSVLADHEARYGRADALRALLAPTP